MDADRSRTIRPRRLTLLTLLLALVVFGLMARVLRGGTPDGVTHVPVAFDAAFGLFGGAGLAWVAARLWRRHGRDSAAMALALGSWAVLAAAVTFRAALFAQADYERGRLPFFALTAFLLLGLAGVASVYRKTNAD